MEKILAVTFIGAVIFIVSPQVSPADVVDWAGTTANDVTSCQYDSKNFTLMVARIHAARIFTDYERHGFFRIGLLPIPVAENVQVEIRSVDCLTNALSELNLGNKPSLAVRRFEFRNLEIKLLNENQPCLSAALARIGRNGTLELSNVCVTNAAGKRMFLSKATLRITNPSVGLLQWKSDGHQQNLCLFNPVSDKKI